MSMRTYGFDHSILDLRTNQELQKIFDLSFLSVMAIVNSTVTPEPNLSMLKSQNRFGKGDPFWRHVVGRRDFYKY